MGSIQEIRIERNMRVVGEFLHGLVQVRLIAKHAAGGHQARRAPMVVAQESFRALGGQLTALRFHVLFESLQRRRPRMRFIDTDRPFVRRARTRCRICLGSQTGFRQAATAKRSRR
jgi:hypothetical protein